ncbi:MAG: hypothetical protein LBQ38_13605 [Spirochaetaceae bacterium]|nr:hypothetical protein [Spirochaetaceae bacterium]
MTDNDFDPVEEAHRQIIWFAEGGLGKGCLVTGVSGKRKAGTLALVRELCEKGAAKPGRDGRPRKLIWLAPDDLGAVLEQYAENAVLVIENGGALLNKEGERRILEQLLENEEAVALTPLRNGNYSVYFGIKHAGMNIKLTFSEGVDPAPLFAGVRFRPNLLFLCGESLAKINPRTVDRCVNNTGAAELWKE